jgi:hypothetical protein
VRWVEIPGNEVVKNDLTFVADSESEPGHWERIARVDRIGGGEVKLRFRDGTHVQYGGSLLVPIIRLRVISGGKKAGGQ